MKMHTKKTRVNTDDLAQRRIDRKTDQMNTVKFLMAITLFIGAIMETPLPQPVVGKLALDCPLVQKLKNDQSGSYTVGSQSCGWNLI